MTDPAVLHRLEALPAGFLDATSAELGRLLPGPTLIHLDGAVRRPLFIALLQHGNETSGLAIVQRLIASIGTSELPRPVSLFIANVEAARHGMRRLDHQPDFNRCWPGTEEADCAETRIMAEVIAEMGPREPVAAIDLHNTTGNNPFHAGLNVLDPRCLWLASRFAPVAVHFTRPRGAMPAAFADHCPALILECGTPGDPAGIEAGTRFLQYCLTLERVPDEVPAALSVFESTALVFVPDSVRFSFSDDGVADLVLHPGIDDWNFAELAAGTIFGRCRGSWWPVRALAPDGREITDEVFTIVDGELRLRRAFMPGLLTGDAHVIRQDCLCHLMERATLPA